MNEKQQQLTFDKGITNVPSDALCSDNALEESLGMVFDNGEHRVVQNPKLKYTADQQTFEQSRLVYIHRFGVKERWLFAYDVQQGVYNIDWYYPNAAGTELEYGGTLNEGVSPNAQAKNFNLSEDDLRNHAFKVTSTGKCLIILDQESISYFLWKDSGYSEAVHIPQPVFDFQLRQITIYSDTSLYYLGSAKGKPDGIVGDSVENQEKYNDFMVGLYSKCVKQIAQKEGFCQAFLVRMALQLYDDSYIFISHPMMMFACVTENAHCRRYSDEIGIQVDPYFLFAKQTVDYTALSDIVKNVSIFVSDGIEPHDLSVDQPFSGWNNRGRGNRRPISDAVYYNSTQHTICFRENLWTGDGTLVDFLQRKERDDIKAELESTSVFYKLCDIGLRPISDYTDLRKYIMPHVVENLTTQEQLPYDDYYSRCALRASMGYSYNSRLNIANVSRGFFEGYGNFLPFEATWDADAQYQEATPGDCDFYVTISTADGDFVVKHSEYSTDYQGIYFYYPDARAKHVVGLKNGFVILNAALTEHPGLNGAYYFKGLPGYEGKEETVSGSRPSSYDNDAMEYLPNYILTSEVDNPFVFKAEGYNNVGIGKVIGMSTITQALSQGQFGQFPLLVFSESGIWAMSVGSSGQFVSIHPMSREVCNNMASITQTDGAVFFSSEKGLMVVAGSDVKCASTQLSGREGAFDGIVSLGNFIEYLREAFIAYDYRDSMLWILKEGQRTCYVYSIASGTFGKYTFTRYIDGAVNYYPDYILQDGGDLYSLLTRPNINTDNQIYSGYIITRPMKLENALALKSIMQIRHVLQFTPYTVTTTSENLETHETVTTETTQRGTMTLRIFASNNLDNWVELHSLRGTPWKYYRFRFDFSNMKATDRFAGTMLITQERRILKLR